MSAPTPSNGNLQWWTLWAKWSSQEKGTWHPLLCHLTDVAMCAEAMWDDVLSPAWKQHLAARLHLTEADARAWIIYLAGLHDLGKACPGFQLQLKLPHIEQRLRAAGLKIPNCTWVPHGTVSTLALRDYLPAHFGFTPSVANEFAVALGGHHGVFPPDADIAKLPDDSLGGNSWKSARETYANLFATLFELPNTAPASCDHEAAVMFAGFVSVVDWIGSSETIFEHNVAAPDGSPILDLTPYRDHARTQARNSLKTLGWLGWMPSATPASFATMFPKCLPPRPVQTAAISLAESLAEPALVIIEEQMGEGKTEAAAYLADTWTTRFGQNGIHFALPTQATTNQMFTRIEAFLKNRYPTDIVNLQLLHGHAALSDQLKSLQDAARTRLLDFNDIEDTENGHPHDGAVIAAAWFASGKRAILAPFGVGTVDQALLAALQVKHFFVRVYGLSSKTVIIDEVHAYDTYMSTIIERLLEWLGAMRVPVILLSATLPSSRRQRLLDAYLHYSPPAIAPTANSTLQPTRYPRITWASPNSAGSISIPVDPERRRTVQLEWIYGRIPDPTANEPFALGERLRTELADAGCCVVICNTVRRAQKVYTALKPYFSGTASDGEPQLDLFHARYRQKDRAEREQRVLNRFGKDGSRPTKAVLVATQVVEQSLDLDFDLMVSDHAPVDLLLQRSGRLHRHAGRVRPSRLATPRLLVIEPDAITADNVPSFDRGSTYVYDPHILFTSWLALRNRTHLTIPYDIELLVEAAYETTTCPDDLSPELQETWEATRAKMFQATAADTDEARNRYIKPPSSDLALADIAAFLRADNDDESHPALQALTRLTGPTISVVCLYRGDPKPLLDPGGASVSLTAKPNNAMTRALLERSLTLSDTRVVYTLLKQDPPTGWAESSMLCRHRHLIFDANHTATVGKFSVQLDPELGIVILNDD